MNHCDALPESQGLLVDLGICGKKLNKNIESNGESLAIHSMVLQHNKQFYIQHYHSSIVGRVG